MQTLSIFDLDRTITRHGTWTPFLLFAVLRRAPWRALLLPVILVAAAGYTLGLLSRGRLKEIMHAAIIGRRADAAQVQALADHYAQAVMASNIYAEAIALIRAEQASGREVIIATASCAFYVGALARHLGVDRVIATKNRHDGDVLTNRIDGKNCYGAAKRTMVEAYFTAHGIVRGAAHIRFYSDHISDVPTFDLADEAIAVNPSPALQRHAAEHGWPVLDWR